MYLNLGGLFIVLYISIKSGDNDDDDDDDNASDIGMTFR